MTNFVTCASHNEPVKEFTYILQNWLFMAHVYCQPKYVYTNFPWTYMWTYMLSYYHDEMCTGISPCLEKPLFLSRMLFSLFLSSLPLHSQNLQIKSTFTLKICQFITVIYFGLSIFLINLNDIFV